MANESEETLPKMLPGAVCAQYVRCGRPGCRCARGQRHGPYFYRFWRQGGRLRKEYVRPAELEQVKAACEARRGFRRQVGVSWGQWRELAALVREVEGR